MKLSARVLFVSLLLAKDVFASQSAACPNLTGEYSCDGNVQEYFSGTTVEISQRVVGRFFEFTLPPSDARNEVDRVVTDGRSHITGTDSTGGIEIVLSYVANCVSKALVLNRYASGIGVSRHTQLYVGSSGELIVTDLISQGTTEKKSSSKCLRTR